MLSDTMLKNVFLFVGILAFASFAAANDEDFKCVDDTHFTHLGSVFECEQDDSNGKKKICNMNYKKGESDFCDIVENICEYNCVEGDETAIKLGTSGYKTKCAEGKVCNTAKDSCTEMCTSKCKFLMDFECVGDSVKISGLLLPCPADTVCNKDKRQPCAMCHSPSGAKSSVVNMLTIEN